MWSKIRRFFSDSETIFLARLQMVLGIAWEIAAAVDWSPVVPPKYLPYYMIAAGILTELARRARADDL